jgi:uncharacterized membrane protein
MKFTESSLRSFYKLISWKLTVTILVFFSSYVVTGGVASAGKITGIMVIVNSIWYYIHERIWNKILAGRMVKE